MVVVSDETEILRLVREGGSRDAYAALWRRHYGAALTQAGRLAHSEAEDVASEAFLQVWVQLQEGRGPERHFRAYLLTVVRNIAARWHGRRSLILSSDQSESEPEPGPSPDEIAETVDEHRRVIEAFEALPERWQEILWLYRVERLSRATIAKRFRMSQNATSVLTRRAQEGLRIEWLRQFLPAEPGPEHAGIVAHLPKYVRGTLSRPRVMAVDAHLAEGCSECAGSLRTLREVAPYAGGVVGVEKDPAERAEPFDPVSALPESLEQVVEGLIEAPDAEADVTAGAGSHAVVGL